MGLSGGVWTYVAIDMCGVCMYVCRVRESVDKCRNPCVGLSVPVAVSGCVCVADAAWIGAWVCGI